MECTKVTPSVRKAKKKQVKDELDRLKQAEKKKRRLEKALATSAAIRSELEKKKEKKKEEQQRLDEEGAAIAEAVALHVLLGEDSDDSCKISPLGSANDINFFMGGQRSSLPHHGISKHSLDGVGWVPNIYRSGCQWNECGNSYWSAPYGHFLGDLKMPYTDSRNWETTEISAGLIAAQAVASLQIAEGAGVEPYVRNRMLRW
ncbi:hypothetical protein NMG60_11022250 [Bertholletia excelsa]